ncbi:DNA mismatch repair protein MutS [Pricia sp. S334]|uniref:DNA mismatch repair protein MutS n=1 Tax=Pricia mediterranea TaxID=3076079 RepID=A0ABU3L6P2_9FLAO|nr:DNA mismatch repair protein MutS [Pricia sp. S334]MDT7829420.1 DNA mismatch repair protein MutS [Pricia sp. S334]
MQDPVSFYQHQIENYSAELSRLQKRLFASSMIRLAVFLAAGLGVYLVFGNFKWVLAIVLMTVGLFLFLVSRHQNLQYERDRLKALVQINETELRVLRRDFQGLPEGNEFKNPDHYFSHDIDLFGRGSFYQYANRTALGQGSETFAGLLMENSIVNIPQKQEAIQELAAMPEWRQHFSAIASLTKAETGSERIVQWLTSYSPFVPKIMKIAPWIFSVISLIVLVLYFIDLVTFSLLLLNLFIGLAISGMYMKKITGLTAEATRVQSTFQQYNKLLTLLEETEFKSVYLQNWKAAVVGETQRTSEIIKKLANQLNSLDKNNNVVYLFLANGYFLRTLHHCYRIENWIQQHGSSVEKWFVTIAHFDAFNSLGNFAFNHPKYAYPVLSSGEIVLKSKAAGHPLLHPEKSVLNDLQIKKEQFFIITGANMAGKSTFLRTASLQIVMANVGLPVCASEVEYSPIKLITSIRTTDSLTDDESYFFSELKRLKFIVDEVQRDTYFIVLDEILKGTNSTDKAKGSRKFVERLVASRSTGIIATHDLSLCEVAKDHPQIENHYFDAEIIDNELHFDYKFKEGICQNMNASFLLRKMEIVD